jgi:hypothetical protein
VGHKSNFVISLKNWNEEKFKGSVQIIAKLYQKKYHSRSKAWLKEMCGW